MASDAALVKCALECLFYLLSDACGQRRRAGDVAGTGNPERDNGGEQPVNIRMPEARSQRRLNRAQHLLRREVLEPFTQHRCVTHHVTELPSRGVNPRLASRERRRGWPVDSITITFR